MEIARQRNPQQPPDPARGRGALHRGAVPSGHLLAHRQHPARGWRREHRRMISWRTMDSPASTILEATPGDSARADVRTHRRGCALEAGAGSLLHRRSAGAPVALRRPLLPPARRPVPQRGTARARTGRCADTTTTCIATPTPRTPSTISRSSARPTWSFCGPCRAAPGIARALHQAAGEITLAQMLHEWAMHDLGHIRQVAGGRGS